MIFETIRVGPLEVNCYILSSGGKKEAVIIDPGSEEDKIKKVIGKHGLRAAIIINTHGHFDHIGCDDQFGVKIYCHKDEQRMLKSEKENFSNFMGFSYSVKSVITAVVENDLIECDEIQLKVIHTPGHTPGGMCLLLKKPEENILFSGDTLFHESIGRTDFSGASHNALIKSIKEKLIVLDERIAVYPGHGPATSIGHEKKHNHFLI